MTEKERKISPEKEKEKDIPDKKGSEDEDELGDEEEDNEIFAVEGADKRKRCNIVFIGHVDSGKSTTCGHILQLKKMVDQRTMEKNIRESEKKGTEGQKFAFILDELEYLSPSFSYSLSIASSLFLTSFSSCSAATDTEYA
ncbi:MAG: hypothetical protein EZS28_042814 [Streblomastix strix]|uniref:Tr-type G domain-containing protein n=1 Tax=Streblomastix strix TaxID=222440 RepID=A0A5J4TTZ0_9EUKA|nr:MAG: hypothetical protein EZS28_042814 [Streblomastix strix]